MFVVQLVLLFQDVYFSSCKFSIADFLSLNSFIPTTYSASQSVNKLLGWVLYIGWPTCPCTVLVLKLKSWQCGNPLSPRQIGTVGHPTCMLHIAPAFILPLHNFIVLLCFQSAFICMLRECILTLLIIFEKYNCGNYATKIFNYN